MRQLSLCLSFALLVVVLPSWLGASSLEWLEEASNGLGDSHNAAVNALASFNGVLYAGIDNTFDKAEVWARVPLADAWIWVVRASGGFGDDGNIAVSSMAGLPGVALYMGTFNYTTGAEIWYTTDGIDFYQTYTDGFGYGAANTDVNSMAVYNNNLYVGTTNGNGLQIHEYADGSWSAVVLNDFPGSTNNVSATCMTVHDGALYVGTENSTTGGEIWYSVNGISWTRQVFGGWGQNSIGSLASVGGALFASVAGDNGVEVYAVGDYSLQVNVDGFGNSANSYGTLLARAGHLFIGVTNFSSGAKVWRLNGFLDWTEIGTGGFGYVNNIRVPALAAHGSGLFAGTACTTGAEIWLYSGIYADGFETGGTVPWSNASP